MRLPDIFTKKYHRSIIKCKRLVSGSAFIPCIIQKKQKQLIKLMLLLLFPSVRK